ncbi:F0F1 ATP synthase subunit B family protein [Albibacillus kandeliae]|uniref:F0F1 ATP synthase subunit B family protein n=1 Tax=Albibacillus kandeliae TaxID=2174228 RepID=UPI000D68B57E|nr:ATPase [Albibacillus kandeliae]
MSFDWSTLLLQTVNAAVLIWLLSRVLWRPLADMIAARRAETEKVMAEAEASRQEARAAEAELERRLAGIEADRAAALADAARQGEAEKSRIIAAAREEAGRIEEAAKDRIAAAGVAAEAALGERAVDLAVDMAARLGCELDGPALRSAALDRILDQVGALSEDDRATLAASVSLCSPAALDPAEQQGLRDRLSHAFTSPLNLTFQTDPGLVAGLELSGPHLVVRSDWRDGLARLRQEILRNG